MSLTGDILRSYRAPRSVMRALVAHDRREGRALFYLMLACGLIYVAQWPRLAREAQLPEAVPFEGLMAGALFAWLFIAPLVFYGAGALLGLVLTWVRRGADRFVARLALFWALLAVSPLALLQGAVAALAGAGTGTGAGVLASILGLAVLVAFGVILTGGLRVALEAGAPQA